MVCSKFRGRTFVNVRRKTADKDLARKQVDLIAAAGAKIRAAGLISGRHAWPHRRDGRRDHLIEGVQQGIAVAAAAAPVVRRITAEETLAWTNKIKQSIKYCYLILWYTSAKSVSPQARVLDINQSINQSVNQSNRRLQVIQSTNQSINLSVSWHFNYANQSINQLTVLGNEKTNETVRWGRECGGGGGGGVNRVWDWVLV